VGLLAPESFFDKFAGREPALVSVLPSYNEHVTRDYGGMNLAQSAVLLEATVTLARAAVIAGLSALISGGAHLAFHASDEGTLSTSEQAGNPTALALPVAVSAGLLVVEWRSQPRTA
jgi:hypothetical protein